MVLYFIEVAVITSAPPKIILDLTGAAGFIFNKESAALLKKYSEKILPYVEA